MVIIQLTCRRGRSEVFRKKDVLKILPEPVEEKKFLVNKRVANFHSPAAFWLGGIIKL